MRLDLRHAKTFRMSCEARTLSRAAWDDSDRFADMVSPEHNLVARLGLLRMAIEKTSQRCCRILRYAFGLVVAAGSTPDLTSGTGLLPGDVIHSVDGLLCDYCSRAPQEAG